MIVLSRNNFSSFYRIPPAALNALLQLSYLTSPDISSRKESPTVTSRTGHDTTWKAVPDTKQALDKRRALLFFKASLVENPLYVGRPIQLTSVCILHFSLSRAPITHSHPQCSVTNAPKLALDFHACRPSETSPVPGM